MATSSTTSLETAAAAWRSGGRLTTTIHLLSGGVSGVILFVIMMVTIVDVAGRDLFNAPLPGAFEMTELLMAALIYAGLPSVSRQESHITVDLLDGITPSAIMRGRQIFVNLLVGGCLAIIAWRLWILAEKMRDYGDVTEYLQIPRAPMIYFMAALSATAAIVALANVCRYLRGAREPAPGFA